MCAHSIDPTDHFAYFDDTITGINFLRYTSDQWQKYGGNSLANHNRLRDQDFESLFEEAGFHLLKHAFAVDARGYEALQQGFEVATEFCGMDPEQICRRNLLFVERTRATRCEIAKVQGVRRVWQAVDLSADAGPSAARFLLPGSGA